MIWNILDYGAVADGRLCTKNIQKAIDACFLAGGGEVVIPAGEYLTGGVRLRSNVTLHLLENAVLKGSICPEDYLDFLNDQLEPIPWEERDQPVSTVNFAPGYTGGFSAYPYTRWNDAVIRAFHAQNIAIIGEAGAEIDGQNCFDELGEEGYRGPHTIDMWFCENITLRGYTIRDSGNWAHAIHNSQNIQVNGITVLGGHDGFDVRTCDNILIEDCKFITGDDCIAGFDNIGVTVRNCYFESACSWFRFGAADMLVENCLGMNPCTYGHRYKLTPEQKRNRSNDTSACRHDCHNVFLYYCDNRAKVRKTPGNILIRNSTFKNPKTVINLPFGHKWCCNRSLGDITFENCVIEDISEPSKITAPAEEPLTLRLLNCTITPLQGYENIPFIKGENICKLDLTGTDISAFAAPEIL